VNESAAALLVLGAGRFEKELLAVLVGAEGASDLAALGDLDVVRRLESLSLTEIASAA
jgi:hypothetical protein